MFDFHRFFLPVCQRLFDSEEGSELVYWIGDDVKFNTGLAFGDITDIALSQHACAFWLGYATRHGEPTWGTHLLAAHRGGVERERPRMRSNRFPTIQ